MHHIYIAIWAGCGIEMRLLIEIKANYIIITHPTHGIFHLQRTAGISGLTLFKLLFVLLYLALIPWDLIRV